MADTQKASELEDKITWHLLQTRGTFDRKEKDKELITINQLAKEYYKLTGKHYDYYKVNNINPNI
jgi:hypothetical protein